MLRDDICVMVCVALIWGTTNSLIKKSSEEYVTTQSNNKKKSNFEVYDWLMNPIYFISVAVNLSGSFLFFYNLADTSIYVIKKSLFDLLFLEISVAGPVVNCLTLVVTAVSGIVINKDKFTVKTAFGMFLVLIGIGFTVI